MLFLHKTTHEIMGRNMENCHLPLIAIDPFIDMELLPNIALLYRGKFALISSYGKYSNNSLIKQTETIENQFSD